MIIYIARVTDITEVTSQYL